MIPSNWLTQYNSQPYLLDTTMCVDIYFSFVVFSSFTVLEPRHTKPEARESTINLIHTFRNYLHYHIKCSKVLSFFLYRSSNSNLWFFPNPNISKFSVDLFSWCRNQCTCACIYQEFYLPRGQFLETPGNFRPTKSNIQIKILRKIMQILHSWTEVSGHFCICGAFFNLHKTQPLPPPHKPRWIRLSRMFLRWIQPSRIV